MIQFNVQDISEYRGQLMGIATLLVIFGHSVGNGVAMPRWMESLCGLSSVGVDIFLKTFHPTRFGLEILPVILKTEQNENSNSDTYY